MCVCNYNFFFFGCIVKLYIYLSCAKLAHFPTYPPLPPPPPPVCYCNQFLVFVCCILSTLYRYFPGGGRVHQHHWLDCTAPHAQLVWTLVTPRRCAVPCTLDRLQPRLFESTAACTQTGMWQRCYAPCTATTRKQVAQMRRYPPVRPNIAFISMSLSDEDQTTSPHGRYNTYTTATVKTGRI